MGGALGGRVIEATSAAIQAVAVALLALRIVLVAQRFLVSDPPHEVEGEKPHAVMFPRVLTLYLLGAMALFCMVPEGAVLDWRALWA